MGNGDKKGWKEGRKDRRKGFNYGLSPYEK